MRDMPVTGTVYVSTLQVSWAWITLPALLQLTTFIMVCYAHMLSWDQNIPPWKSSVIATVLLGAKTQQLVEMEMPEELAEIERALGHVEVEGLFPPFRDPSQTV
jgi:hypothetical protein